MVAQINKANVMRELSNSVNWKPKIKDIANKLGLSASNVSEYFHRFEKAGKLFMSVKVLSDDELKLINVRSNQRFNNQNVCVVCGCHQRRCICP